MVSIEYTITHKEIYVKGKLKVTSWESRHDWTPGSKVQPSIHKEQLVMSMCFIMAYLKVDWLFDRYEHVLFQFMMYKCSMKIMQRGLQTIFHHWMKADVAISCFLPTRGNTQSGSIIRSSRVLSRFWPLQLLNLRITSVRYYQGRNISIIIYYKSILPFIFNNVIMLIMLMKFWHFPLLKCLGQQSGQYDQRLKVSLFM